MAHVEEGQQHPLGIYIKVWAWLFVLSTGSYLVDYFHVQSYARWTLIIIFMLAKAGLIVSVFMHIKWARMALSFASLLPPSLLLVLIAIMAIDSDYTFLTRGVFFGSGS